MSSISNKFHPEFQRLSKTSGTRTRSVPVKEKLSIISKLIREGDMSWLHPSWKEIKCTDVTPSSMPKQPIVVRNSTTSVAADELLEFVDNGAKEWDAVFSRLGGCEDDVVTGEKGTFFENSRKVTTPDSDEIRIELPAELSDPVKSCLLVDGPWFSQGHVELSGNDSVATVICGQKLWVIAHSISSGIKLER